MADRRTLLRGSAALATGTWLTGCTTTAFVHRSSHFLARYIASGALGKGTWLNGLYTALRPYASGEAYQNYTDPRLTNWRQAYYGSAAGRLTQLKHQWDPDRLFDFPQAL